MSDIDEEELHLREEVKTGIEEVASTYQSVDVKPAFTNDELVVAAILCSDTGACTEKEVYRWIINTFPYYRGVALEECILSAAEGVQAFLSDDLDLSFTSYEAPLTNLWGKFDREAYKITAARQRRLGESGTHTDNCVYSVPVSQGRLFLSNILDPPRKGIFPFQDLPAELRIRVYEMLFSFTDIAMLHKCRRDHLFMDRREHDPEGNLDRPPVHEDKEVRSRPVDSIFAILFVNKQTYKEALPYFWRINVFKF